MSRVLGVNASQGKDSRTFAVVEAVLKGAEEAGADVRRFDLREKPFPVFDPDQKPDFPAYREAKESLEWADAVVLGTPDYHGAPSGAAKNFFDHFWKEWAGKVFAVVSTSFEKGLTVQDHFRTSIRQCYGWAVPYGVCGHPKEDFSVTGEVASEGLKSRTRMLGYDLQRYGTLIHGAFREDLKGNSPGFCAHYRPKHAEG